MADEPCSPHGWTLDTLETYMSDKISALDRFCVAGFQASEKQVNLALTAADKAVAKAEIATDKRFEGVNELRGAMADQAAHLMPRAEYQVQHNGLADRLGVLETTVTATQSSLTARREGVGSIGAIVLGILVGLNSLFAIGALALELLRH